MASSCPHPLGAEGEPPRVGEGCAGRCPPGRRVGAEGRSWGSRWASEQQPGACWGHEGRRDRGMVEFRALRAGRRAKGKLASLGFTRG